ncbi:hypothetical protein CEQ90_04460 [Lewinellaceae bacterium SD302]|nr:hypothetical protein CEQ90_04460 [Lewinellaceae bacterium SD302]
MKRRHIYFTLLVILGLGSTLAAQCPPPGTVFTKQAQIDAMRTQYPSCSRLEGNLVIQEAQPGAVTSLEGLSGLNDVTGDVVIRRVRDLASLVGLDNLQRIGGELNIQGNPRLTNFNGLGSLTSVGSQTIIANNVNLSDLSGLESLTIINGSLYLRRNVKLSRLNGLASLTSIVGDLVISGNPTLLSLDGLASLTNIGTTSPRAQLQITDNPSLQDLSGLGQLNFSALTYLEITNCPSLSGSGRSGESLCRYLSSAGRARVYGNGAGFDSVEVLRSGCN